MPGRDQPPGIYFEELQMNDAEFTASASNDQWLLDVSTRVAFVMFVAGMALLIGGVLFSL